MTEKQSARHHFALFDSLRGLAVLSVIGFHVASLTGRLSEGPFGRVMFVLGGEAVIVFFVISGFLLYRPFVAARAAGRPLPRTGAFLLRRAFRIVPAYWVILTVFAIYPALHFPDGWWRYYLFLQLYDGDTVLAGLPVAWTLCVEVTYYLLLPLWALGVRRLRPGPGPEGWVRPELIALAAAALGGFVIQVLAARQQVSHTVADTIIGQFPWMALGMALAVASVAVRRREQQPSWAGLVERRSGAIWLIGAGALAGLAAIAPTGLFGLLAAVTSVRPFGEALLHIVLSGVLAAAFVLPAIFGEHAGGIPRRILRFAPVAWIGTVSYSVYLWHLPVAQWIANRHDPLHFSETGLKLLGHVETGSTLLLYVATMALTAILAALTYYLVERPAIDYSHRRTARQTARGA
jgi:peptidoglycan/LPS O-acetylase OafA/YrhL